MEKVLILVPHQDDEIIMCGSFLKGLVERKYQVYVVYMTNGDYVNQIGEIRLQEALNVMELYGIPESQVIFMGYANQYAPDNPHIYNAELNEIVKSRFGNMQTYGLPNHPEYCFQKYGEHHLYQRKNILSDLKEIVIEILPDIILATDVEMHVDHIANSLFLDEVIGILRKKLPDFKPIIYKKQEYSTAWYSAADYKPINNAAAKQSNRYSYVNHETTAYLNPYIRWHDRIRIPIDESARTEKKEDNIVYKALKLYSSQNAVDYFDSLVNSDSVFWRRRTDSVTYQSKVSATSGQASYLNDFKIIDCMNITHANGWCTNASVWHPALCDEKPVITFEFPKEVIISEIIIYQQFCPKSEILYSVLLFDGRERLEIERLEKRKPTMVRFTPRRVQKVEYIIEKCSDSMVDVGITEIEIYEEHASLLSYAKITIDDNFVYDYFVNDRLRGKIGVYQIFQDGSTKMAPDLEDYEMLLLDEKGNRKEQYLHDNRLCGEMTEQRLILKIVSKKDRNISDMVVIRKTKEELLLDAHVINNEKKMLLKWITLKQDHIDFSSYFENHSLYTIAVYGLGEQGIRFIDELKSSNVTIKYVVDKGTKQFAADYPLYAPNDTLEEVDAMVVTVVNSFQEIEEQMAYKLMCPIISLEEIIESLA